LSGEIATALKKTLGRLVEKQLIELTGKIDYVRRSAAQMNKFDVAALTGERTDGVVDILIENEVVQKEIDYMIDSLMEIAVTAELVQVALNGTPDTQ